MTTRTSSNRLKISLLVVFLLAGCSRAQPAAADILPLNEATDSTEPTATYSPIPTVTRLQSLPTANGTESFRATQFAGFPRACESWSANNTLVSPDGNWLALGCGIAQGTSFIVLNRDGSVRWILTAEEAFGQTEHAQYFPDNIGVMFPFHWSNDSASIYFFIAECCRDPAPDYGNFAMSSIDQALYRLDTWNGKWAQVTGPSHYYSFSPTGRRLVSMVAKTILGEGSYEPVDDYIEMSVLDLKTGDGSIYRLDHTLAAAYVVWSEDGLSFYFSSVLSPEDDSLFDYVIYEANLVDQKLTEIIRLIDSDSLIYPVDLTQEDVLVLETKKYGAGYQATIGLQYLDLRNGQIIDPTPTPQP